MYQYIFHNNILKEGQEGIAKSEAGENAYEISLPDGEYYVRIYAGDPEDEGDVNLHVRINGEAQRPIWINDRSINSGVYGAQVREGILSLEFSGKYVCIQGIEVSETIQEIPQGVRCTARYSDVPQGVQPEMRESRTDTPQGGSWEICITWDQGKNRQYQKVHIYRKDQDIDLDPICITADHTGCYRDLDVKECGTYEYTLCFADEGGFEGERTKPCFCQAAEEDYPRGEVKNLRISDMGEKKITLTWQGNGRAAAYQIYRQSKWGKPKKLAKLPADENSQKPDETRRMGEEFLHSYTDQGVTADVPFTYYVEALNRGGISARASVRCRALQPGRRRRMETLDRGLVAVKTDEGFFLSWRLMPKEYEQGAGFHLYVNGKRITEQPVFTSCNYLVSREKMEELLGKEISIDKGEGSVIFEVKTTDAGGKILSQEDYDITEMGMRMDRGNRAAPWEKNYLEIPLDKPEPYTAPDGNTYEYTANDASAADLDGDGEYEIILKWDCNGKDNSHKGYSGICLLDAYKLDGTKLWRIQLGHNIRCGAHYTQFMVYDFDGDGYGELICKTADGTVDGTGKILGDAGADYRNSDGFILEGPEYLTLFDGRTGEALDTVLYVPDRGTIVEYGDSLGNRVDRFLACVAYLDGEHPSAVMCRGYYDHGRPTNLTAWDVADKKLKLRWKFRADSTQNISYTNQGFHNLAVCDVDGDGCDEIIYGACVIDEDGTGLYSTGLEHGDAMHVGRFTAESEGYDYYGIHEHADCPFGMEARDAGTGEIRWGKFTGRDTARGLTAKIDPRYAGNQMWAMPGDCLYNYKDGKMISSTSPESVNFAIWWDGDLLRELLDHKWFGYEKNISLPVIYKWDWEEEKLKEILTPEGCAANNGSKGNPCLQASLFGDWREEAVWRTTDSSALRIYTTTALTEHKFYTFMADEVYRLGIAWQNTAYNQPPQTSFYIGDDMKDIPVPHHYYVEGAFNVMPHAI